MMPWEMPPADEDRPAMPPARYGGQMPWEQPVPSEMVDAVGPAAPVLSSPRRTVSLARMPWEESPVGHHAPTTVRHRLVSPHVAAAARVHARTVMQQGGHCVTVSALIARDGARHLRAIGTAAAAAAHTTTQRESRRVIAYVRSHAPVWERAMAHAWRRARIGTGRSTRRAWRAVLRAWRLAAGLGRRGAGRLGIMLTVSARAAAQRLDVWHRLLRRALSRWRAARAASRTRARATSVRDCEASAEQHCVVIDAAMVAAPMWLPQVAEADAARDASVLVDTTQGVLRLGGPAEHVMAPRATDDVWALVGEHTRCPATTGDPMEAVDAAGERTNASTLEGGGSWGVCLLPADPMDATDGPVDDPWAAQEHDALVHASASEAEEEPGIDGDHPQVTCQVAQETRAAVPAVEPRDGQTVPATADVASLVASVEASIAAPMAAHAEESVAAPVPASVVARVEAPADAPDDAPREMGVVSSLEQREPAAPQAVAAPPALEPGRAAPREAMAPPIGTATPTTPAGIVPDDETPADQVAEVRHTADGVADADAAHRHWTSTSNDDVERDTTEGERPAARLLRRGVAEVARAARSVTRWRRHVLEILSVMVTMGVGAFAAVGWLRANPDITARLLGGKDTASAVVSPSATGAGTTPPTVVGTQLAPAAPAATPAPTPPSVSASTAPAVDWADSVGIPEWVLRAAAQAEAEHGGPTVSREYAPLGGAAAGGSRPVSRTPVDLRTITPRFVQRVSGERLVSLPLRAVTGPSPLMASTYWSMPGRCSTTIQLDGGTARTTGRELSRVGEWLFALVVPEAACVDAAQRGVARTTPTLALRTALAHASQQSAVVRALGAEGFLPEDLQDVAVDRSGRTRVAWGVFRGARETTQVHPAPPVTQLAFVARSADGEHWTIEWAKVSLTSDETIGLAGVYDIEGDGSQDAYFGIRADEASRVLHVGVGANGVWRALAVYRL